MPINAYSDSKLLIYLKKAQRAREEKIIIYSVLMKNQLDRLRCPQPVSEVRSGFGQRY
jgi:hypothetical protein